MSLKILTVVGARPQFIKAAGLSRYIRNHASADVEEKIIHTGQHYDSNMSDVFFDELDIPRPDFQLSARSSLHGASTGQMLEGVEEIMLSEKPDWVLIYGDTNSTLAGALAAAKLHIPVAHVEAGLRSFNKRMPEEVNRVMSDHVSSRLYCPTDTAVRNLKNEGITDGVMNVGDIMLEVTQMYSDAALANSGILQTLQLEPKQFALVTIHRAENTDSPQRLAAICESLGAAAKKMTVVFPLHPRTRKCIEQQSLWGSLEGVHILEPLPYLDLQALQRQARLVLTDSGGVQKEAFFCRTPCITVRDETEWSETLQAGWNQLVDASAEKIGTAIEQSTVPQSPQSEVFGAGNTAELIIKDLISEEC